MNFTHMKNMIFTAASLLGSCIAQALGGWDTITRVLLTFMIIDFITGWLLAAVWKKSGKSVNGSLDSGASFKGIIKKCVILVMVFMAASLDQVVGSTYIRTTVCFFFIANEGLSIIENTAMMGVQYPPFIKNMLEVMHEKAGNGGES